MREEDKEYFQEPEFQETLRKYEEAIQERSSVYMDADDLTDIAEYYMVQEQEDKANEAISLAISMHPNAVDPQVFLARQQMFHNNLYEAQRICNEIEDQEDREVVFLRAELMIRNGLLNEAIEFLLNVYEEEKTNKGDLLYDIACIFLDYDYYDEAMLFATKLHEEYPSYAKVNDLLVDIKFSSGNFNEAIPYLNTILDNDPYNIKAWLTLAEANRAEEKYQEAIDNTEFVLAIEPENEKAIITKAHCFIHLNNFEVAHGIYQQYLDKHPDNASFLYLDGTCLACVEKFEESVIMLRKAIPLHHGEKAELMHIYLQLAYVESKLHNVDNALTALTKAKELTDEGVMIEYNLLVGEVLLDNDEKEKAENHFKLAIDESEDKRTTLLNIGITYGECQYYHDAIEILTALQELYPGEEGRVAVPYLAYCYYNTKDAENFLKNLKESVHVNKETTQFLFERHFPNISPEEYYLYAFNRIYGRFPEDWE